MLDMDRIHYYELCKVTLLGLGGSQQDVTGGLCQGNVESSV